MEVLNKILGNGCTRNRLKRYKLFVLTDLSFIPQCLSLKGQEQHGSALWVHNSQSKFWQCPSRSRIWLCCPWFQILPLCELNHTTRQFHLWRLHTSLMYLFGGRCLIPFQSAKSLPPTAICVGKPSWSRADLGDGSWWRQISSTWESNPVQRYLHQMFSFFCPS